MRIPSILLVAALGLGGCPGSCRKSEPTPAVEKPPTEPAAKATFACELSGAPVQPLSGGLSLVLRVKNVGTKPASFGDGHTPFEGLRTDLLRIEAKTGKAMPFQGAPAEHAPAGPEDQIEVAPGAEQGVAFTVGRNYPLKPGTYRITYRGQPLHGLPASNTVTVTLR